MIKSVFVATPGIERCPNYYLIQLLIRERIRSVLMGDTFVDNARELVVKYLNIPPHYKTQEQIDKYIKSEAKEVTSNFLKFETTPGYQEIIRSLKQLEGSRFNITSFTMSGIMVLVEVEDENVHS